MVFSEIVTDGQWMRAGEMSIFRRFSPAAEGHQLEVGETEAIETARRLLEPEEIYFLSFQRILPRLTLILIGLNVLIFVLQSIAGGSTDPWVLIKFGAYSQPLILSHGEYWRLLTHIFLHIGLPHLLVNMGVLFVVGMVLEGLYGKERFLIIYFIAGLAGGIASLFLVKEQIGGGASGAIFGLIGTVVVFGIRYRNRIPKRFKRAFGIRILPFLVIDLILGFITPNINIPAHIGGLLGGAATALILTPRIFHRPEIREREPRKIKIIMYAIIAVLSISIGAAAFDMLDIGKNAEEQIIAEYEQAIELSPKDENNYLILYTLYTKAIGRGPDGVEIYYDKLIGLCEKAIEHFPDDLSWYAALTSFYQEQIRREPQNTEEMYDKLIGLCEKAIEQFPDDNLGCYGALITLYEERIKQEPENIEEIYDKLTGLYQIVIKKEPNSAQWYNNLAWSYVQRDIKPKEAIHLAQMALKLKPGDVATLDTLAWAYLKNGQYELSLNAFEKVLEIELEEGIGDAARRRQLEEIMESSWDGVLELAKSEIDREDFLNFYRRMSEKVPEDSDTRPKLESALQILQWNEGKELKF